MTSALVERIISQGYRLASHSWEYGTFAEALLEWYDPYYSVFGNNPFPDGKIPVANVSDVRALTYVKPHISINSSALVDGNGSAGDPASLGVAAILIGQTQPAYLAAAGRQVEHLLTTVPRWSNGAISHREDVAELWADSIYMAPPTLAYYGVATSNITLLSESIAQCNAYRDVLSVPAASSSSSAAAAGLWHHIIGPQSQDLGIWSTGNAWAAAGMARVLATAKKSPFAHELAPAIAELGANIKVLLDGAMAVDAREPAEPLLRNYLNDTAWFGELSGTTLLTAVAYRMLSLEPGTFAVERYGKWADEKREAVTARIGDDGLLAPVVNPLDWYDTTPGTQSPEAQAFAVLMFAAHRSFCQGGACEMPVSD
ncbi:Six-hairpin glycosidase-like protein [Macrophomina phaseolina MS6]|uniref:Six-hairpin glycosidase-like protein n=1 Tax=Macrophomina phaseolina (strain MS6) TaxID=1126212 RepID=K2RDU7_MACPH|nr:Six-hairpin glycosidase-like protein [Macrophomina phaseolina MS6]